MSKTVRGEQVWRRLSRGDVVALVSDAIELYCHEHGYEPYESDIPETGEIGRWMWARRYVARWAMGDLERRK